MRDSSKMARCTEQVHTLASGDKYTGDWVDDQRTGHGIYTWPDGNRYEGQFKGGKCTEQVHTTLQTEISTQVTGLTIKEQVTVFSPRMVN